ncbi:unnamed protein product [Caenorhabditis auriculariae]|uniref:Uncharacterized protein n=1 Tax=Caenorhabditis auriculariae TaxID=2777116 RepID=A0A8S1GQV6_9PELO|nr:unnamed protein product [Caenorhabditis auriculariae]
MVSAAEEAAAAASSPSNVIEGTPEVRAAVEYGRRLLFSALDGLDGDKTIVWDADRNLMQRVNLFAGTSLLSAHGVVANHGIETRKAADTPHVVFFLSPTVPSLDRLCDYIDNVKNDPKTLYQVFFIPEAWYVVREKLKERQGGKYAARLESIREIPLSWLPRDGECLSLSQPQLPSRLLLNGDWTLLHKCAVALNQLIELSNDGRPNPSPSASSERKIAVYSRGKWSQDIAGMLEKLRNSKSDSETVKSNTTPSSSTKIKINRIVVIDRWIDPLTPMLTQLTYAGLLDEVYGIGMVNSIKKIPNRQVKRPPFPVTISNFSVLQAEFEEKDDADPFMTKEIYLTDEIFSRLKHSHINGIGSDVAAILTELRNDENFDKDTMSVAEYAVLVKKMPRILKRKTLTSTHMRLAEMSRAQLYRDLSDNVKAEKELLENSDGDKMMPFIEEAIYDASDLNRGLRLVAVHSLTAGGLKPSVLQSYRRIITHSYGVSALNKLLKMQKMGLVRERGGSGKVVCEYAPLLYPQMRKQYDQLPANVSETSPTDAAYAYSGFAPLIVRILEEGDRLRWVGWQRVVAGGSAATPTDATADAAAQRLGARLDESDDDGTAVFVVGGVTRAEVAAIRCRLPNVRLIATTAMLTGNVLLDSITTI